MALGRMLLALALLPSWLLGLLLRILADWHCSSGCWVVWINPFGARVWVPDGGNRMAQATHAGVLIHLGGAALR